MAYLLSNDVYVFPVANRTGSLTASLPTEYNLVKLVTRLTSQESFVISNSVVLPKEGEATSYFEFCIKGYYFRVPTAELIQDSTASPIEDRLQDGETLYAAVKLSEDSLTTVNGLGPQVTAASSTQGIDTGIVEKGSFANNSRFTSLEFSTSSSDQDLALITRTGDTYTIPPESLVRMCTDASHRYVTIDDGDLDLDGT